MPGGVVFRVRVQPRAGRDEVAGVEGGALKVRLTAPPVEGRANEACLRLLAERLGLPRRRLALVAGERGRDKLVRAEGLDEAALRRALGI